MVEVAKRTELPLARRRGRSIFGGAPRSSKGGKEDWETLLCTLSMMRNFGMSCHILYRARIVIFYIGHNLPLYRHWERCSIFHYYCIWLEICVYEYIIFHFFILLFLWLHICIHYVECSNKLQLMCLQYLLLTKK